MLFLSTAANANKSLWSLIQHLNELIPCFGYLLVLLSIMGVVFAVIGAWCILGTNQLDTEGSYPGSIHTPWGDS